MAYQFALVSSPNANTPTNCAKFSVPNTVPSSTSSAFWNGKSKDLSVVNAPTIVTVTIPIIANSEKYGTRKEDIFMLISPIAVVHFQKTS